MQVCSFEFFVGRQMSNAMGILIFYLFIIHNLRPFFAGKTVISGTFSAYAMISTRCFFALQEMIDETGHADNEGRVYLDDFMTIMIKAKHI